MFRHMYVVYGAVVLIFSTITNLNYASTASSTSSGWYSHSNGVFWGGSGGSTGGFSSGGSHK
jgi:hypothetical protein